MTDTVSFANLGHSAADHDDADMRIGLVRAFRSILRIAFRSSPTLMVLVFAVEPIGKLAGVLLAAAVGLVASAAIDRSSSGVAVGAIAVVVSFGFSLALSTAGLSLRRYVAERIGHELDVELSLLTSGITSIEHLERPDFLDRIELLRADPQGVGNVVNSAVLWFSSLATAVATIAVLSRVHPMLTALPLVGLLGVWSNARFQKRWQKFEDIDAPRQRLRLHLFGMSTSASMGKEIRVFGLREEISRRHQAAWAAHERECFDVNRLDAIDWTVFGVAQAIAWVTAIGLVAWAARRGSVSAGGVVTVIMLGGRLNSVLTSAVDEASNLARMLRAAKRFVWLRDYATASRRLDPGTAPAPGTIRRGITLEDVSFTYAGAGTPALRDVNLHLSPGSVVAIVGDNGAGKTTLVKLLCRLYDPAEGAIRVDGVDLRDIDSARWRGCIAAAFQDYLQLEFLARTAIGVGDLDRVDDAGAVDAAVTRAGADDVVKALERGLDTQLGRRWNGAELSGGQWQKVALSRGLMRDEPLLTVLDEPTAALDAVTEQALFDRFAAAADERRSRGAITVLVSHRFSTVRHADLIIVLEHGSVIDVGTHAELMARQGLYAQLFTLQAQAYR